MSKKKQRWDLIAFAALLALMMGYAYLRSSEFYEDFRDQKSSPIDP